MVNLSKLIGFRNLDIITSKKGSVVPQEIMDITGVGATDLCIIIDFKGKLCFAEKGKPVSIIVLPIVSLNKDFKYDPKIPIYPSDYETASDGKLGIVINPEAAVILNGEDMNDSMLIGYATYHTAVPDHLRDYIIYSKLHAVYDRIIGEKLMVTSQQQIMAAINSQLESFENDVTKHIEMLVKENERIKAKTAEEFALDFGVKMEEVTTNLAVSFKDAMTKMGINFEPTTTVEDVVKEPEPEPAKKKSDGIPKVTKKTSVNLVEIPTTFTNIEEFFGFISYNYGEAKLNCVINIYYADILHDINKVEGGIKRVYYSRKYIKKELGKGYYDQIVATMSNIHVLTAVNKEDNHDHNKVEDNSDSEVIPNTTATETKQKSSGNVLRVQGGYQCFGRTFTPKQAKLILAAEGTKDISERAKIAKGFNEDKIYNKYLNAFKEFVRSGESI